MAYKPARPGSEGNMRLLKEYGGGSKGPRQSYATGGAVKGNNPSLDEGMEAAPIAKLDGPKSSKKDKGSKDKKDAKTSINIVVMGKPDAPAAPGPSGMVPPGPPPPMLPPGPPPGGPPMPMRASGGRVKREDISASDQAGKQDVMGTSPGKYAKGGKVHGDAAEDKKMIAKMVHKHEKKDHPGTKMTTFCAGGMAKRAMGGPAKAPTEKGMLAEKGYQGGGGGAIGRLEKMKAYGRKK